MSPEEVLHSCVSPWFSLNQSLHRDSLSSKFSSLEALKKDRCCLSLLMLQFLAFFCFFGLFDCLFSYLLNLRISTI